MNTELIDLSGNHRHAVIHNWVDTTVTLLNGKMGNYLWMNIHEPAEERTYLQVENDGSLFSSIGERIVVGGWILPTTYSVGNVYTPLLSTRAGDDNPIFYLSLLFGKPRITLYDAAGKAILDKSVTPPFTLENTKWYFLAVVIEPDNHKAWYVVGDRNSGEVWTSQALTFSGTLNRSCTADLIWGMLDETYWYAGGLDEWFLDCDCEATADDLADYFRSITGGNTTGNNTTSRIQFGLCYIDNDNVPELLIADGASPSSQITLVTYANGTLHPAHNIGSLGNVYYRENENVLIDEESGTDTVYTEVFHLETGTLVSDWSGKKQKSHSGAKPDDADEFFLEDHIYLSFGTMVGEAEYHDKYSEYVPAWFAQEKEEAKSYSVQKQTLMYACSEENIEECFRAFPIP